MTVNIIIAAVLSCVLAYALGSLSFSIIISKFFYKKDIRQFGSGNAGMTNILRTFGKKAAAFTVVGDIGKGIVAVFLARAIFIVIAESLPVYGAHIAAICAVLGHLFPVFFGFKGGKGVSVAAGTILATEPVVFLVLLVVFISIIAISKIVSLSSVSVAVAYPILTGIYTYFFNPQAKVLVCIAFATIMAGIIIFMHRENIKRLANGTEFKFGQKK